MDFSTIDLKALRRLPIYKLPPTYTLGSPGMGCYGDPPGYPSYFQRPIYTKFGNQPPKAPDAVIKDGNTLRVVDRGWYGSVESWEEKHEAHKAIMKKIYKPLPLEHPRVQGWINETLRHYQSCWIDPSKNEKIQRNAGELIIRKYGEIGLHAGVVKIREFYPEYKPLVADISDGLGRFLGQNVLTPDRSVGNWWTTENEAPSPDKCPGQYSTPHPVNTTWCQWCGWSMTPEEKEAYRLANRTPEDIKRDEERAAYREEWKRINSLPHEEKYDAIIEKIGGLEEIGKKLSPLSLDYIRQCLEEGDEHLNKIALSRWDKMAGAYFLRGVWSAGGKFTLDQTQGWPRHLSLAERVCTLKRAAKRLATQ